MNYHVHLDNWLVAVFSSESKAEDFCNELIEKSECLKVYKYCSETDSDSEASIWYYSSEYDCWFTNISIDGNVK